MLMRVDDLALLLKNRGADLVDVRIERLCLDTRSLAPDLRRGVTHNLQPHMIMESHTPEKYSVTVNFTATPDKVHPQMQDEKKES